MAHKDDKEQLSLLTDGTLTSLEAARTVGMVAGSEELRRAWMRYHLIGEVMRTPGRVAWSHDLAVRVRDAVAQEPALLAPRQRRSETARWFKPLAGLAIAASVAAAAMLFLPRMLGNQPVVINTAPSLASAPAAEANSGTVFLGAQPAGWSSDNAAPHAVTVVKAIPRSRLNGYLVNYSEQRALIGSPGMPYVRVVGYEADQP